MLASCELPDYPSFILVGDEMRVASVSRLSVLVDQFANDLDALSRSMSTFHNNAGQVAIVDTSLRVRSHLHKLFTILSPHIADGYTMLVETSIGEWRREAFEVGILHRKVLGSVPDLWDFDTFARQGGIFGDADRDSRIGWV
jgi:hypothetical protein